MITDGEKWYYLAVKKISALSEGITSNHNGDFNCLKFFHTFRTKINFKKHKNVCKSHGYCYTEMPKKYNNISMEKSLRKFHSLFMLT